MHKKSCKYEAETVRKQRGFRSKETKNLAITPLQNLAVFWELQVDEPDGCDHSRLVGTYRKSDPEPSKA